MKRFALISAVLGLSFSLMAQRPDSIPVRRPVKGQVLDAYTQRKLAYAHIINQHTAQGIIADTSGLFEIPATSGDTLFISALGYHFDIHPVTAVDADSLFSVKLMLRTYTLREVVIHELDTYEKFKKGFMEVQVESERYQVPGLPFIQPRSIPLLRDTNYLKSAGFAINSPVSFLYYNFSRREKNKRLYYELLRDDELRAMAEERFDDGVLARITGLKQEELGDFKDFCNFQPGVILGLSDYEYYILVRRKLAEFRNFRQSQNE